MKVAAAHIDGIPAKQRCGDDVEPSDQTHALPSSRSARYSGESLQKSVDAFTIHGKLAPARATDLTVTWL
eukprot:6491289-Amphidinium_carterae.2